MDSLVPEYYKSQKFFLNYNEIFRSIVCLAWMKGHLVGQLWDTQVHKVHIIVELERISYVIINSQILFYLKNASPLTGIWTTSGSSSLESLFICWHKNLWNQWRTYGITGERNLNVVNLHKIIKI